MHTWADAIVISNGYIYMSVRYDGKTWIKIYMFELKWTNEKYNNFRKFMKTRLNKLFISSNNISYTTVYWVINKMFIYSELNGIWHIVYIHMTDYMQNK